MTPVSAPTAAGKLTERRSPPRLLGGWIAAPIMILCALLALCAGVARAEVPRLVPNGTFAAEGGPLGIAVDQSNGDVFTTGFIDYKKAKELGISVFSAFGQGEKFDAAGRLLSPPSPFAKEVISWGAAVNPTDGDLYSYNVLSSEIDTYDPNTGQLRSSFPVPPLFTEEGILGGEVSQLATDSAGDVYVSNEPGNEVLEYNEKGELLHEFTGSSEHPLKGPTGVAIDSSGDVWVADDGNNRIEEFSSPGAGAPVKIEDKPVVEFASEGVQDLALYEHEGAVDVLAIVNNSADSCGAQKPPCAHLAEYSSTGVQLADVGAGDFGPTKEAEEENYLHKYDMVAVDQASGRVYVTDTVNDLVWVFQPPAAPVLGTESAVEVGISEAKLGALVNAGGATTSYRFEYLTEAAFQVDKESFSGPEQPVSVPFPEGSAVGFSSRTVWAGAKGLLPGTTYRYRAVVTNGLGTVVGPAQTFTTQTKAQVACPNEQERGGFSTALPDCRAYELVTPVGRTSFQPDTESSAARPFFPGGGFTSNLAASDGDRMSYVAAEVAPGSQTAGLEYVATRGANGWSSEDVLPLQRYNGDRCTQNYEETIGVLSYSADLSKAVIYDGSLDGGDLYCDWEVEVVPGEPMGVKNLLLRDNTSGSYQLIDLTPPGVPGTGATLVAASEDGNRIVFEEFARLTPDALPNTIDTYEWSSGVVRLAFVLPSGAPAVGGAFVGVSDDGSEVFFTAGGKLYMRLNGERTVQLDETRGGSGPGGGGSFAAVTADGSQVFFTANATAGLTSDTHPGSGANLYRYEVGTGDLSDLAGEVEGLTGISEDGSHVYFASKGVLSGSQANQFGETAQSGRPNLYLDHDGTSTFVMHEAEGARISANGEFLAFNSTGSVTGYDNIDAITEKPDPEIYLYSAASNRFACASCNPSGEAPTGGGVFLGGGHPFFVPGWSSYGVSVPHYVSDNGQVFFQTGEALLPSDTDGQQDVYEYDDVSGLHLISSGTSVSGSTLLDASASGDDVFFLGRQALVPRDTGGEANRIYDARVGGGFPETALAPVCTTADSCRVAPEPQPLIFGEPPKKTVKCKKNFVRKRVKKKEECVRKPKAKKANRRAK
jgi:DNA-binding beta-propeller fold protein YncE